MIFAAFLVATTLVLAMYAYGAWRDFHRFGDLLGAAQLLLIVLALSVAFHKDQIFLVLVDFAAVLATGAWFAFRRYTWSALLCLTFFAQLAVHLWFFRFSPQDIYAQYVHILSLNALAVLQLPIIGWPGARHVARRFGAFLLRRGDRGYSLGHGAVP